MQQFNGYYRAFFKQRLGLSNPCIDSCRVLQFNINVDLCSSTSSSFTVEAVPNLINTGDVLILLDQYGTKLYTGVIDSFDAYTITCNDILSLFDDSFPIASGTTSINGISTKAANIYFTLWKGAVNDDGLLIRFLNQFIFDSDTTTKTFNRTYDPNQTINVYDELIKMYTYQSVIIDVNISLNAEKPTITSKLFDETSQFKIIDNSVYIPTMTDTSEIESINKLMLFRKDEDNESYNHTYIGSWYLTPSGITQDSASIDRLSTVTTNIQYLEFDATSSDITSAINDNLASKLYSHQIEVELLINNKLYNYNSFILGKGFSIYIKDKFYQTIYTGFTIDKPVNESISTIKLIFGKARTKASQRYFQ